MSRRLFLRLTDRRQREFIQTITGELRPAHVAMVTCHTEWNVNASGMKEFCSIVRFEEERDVSLYLLTCSLFNYGCLLSMRHEATSSLQPELSPVGYLLGDLRNSTIRRIAVELPRQWNSTGPRSSRVVLQS